jgi:hypothetical protein
MDDGINKLVFKKVILFLIFSITSVSMSFLQKKH